MMRRGASLKKEFSLGRSGKRDSASVNAEYRLSDLHALYGSYTHSTDTTSGDPLYGNSPTGLTLGQRWRISDQVNLFNESQFLKSRQESGIDARYLVAQGCRGGEGNPLPLKAVRDHAAEVEALVAVAEDVRCPGHGGDCAGRGGRCSRRCGRCRSHRAASWWTTATS